MLELLKDAVRFGYLEDWPGDAEDFILLIHGIHHLQNGAIWAGICDMQRISRWHQTAVRLLTKYVPEEVLLNAAAELYHSAFKRDKHLLLVLGAVLGPVAVTLPDYFKSASRFITRVVGVRYKTCLSLAKLEPGMQITFALEKPNQQDPESVVVIGPGDIPLGYLNPPLAATLAARYLTGEAFSAHIAAVLGSAYDINERLHIEVYKDVFSGKCTFLVPGERKLLEYRQSDRKYLRQSNRRV